MRHFGWLLIAVSTLAGQQTLPPANAGKLPQPLEWTSEQDHQNMLDQLGIKALRPGPSGNENAPNHANYDESNANPFPNLPDPLILNNGRRVTTPEMWYRDRRPQIVEDFEREVLGRVPKNAPKVAWMVTNTSQIMVGPYPAVSKELVGHVDNSSYPLINVDIQMTVVTPAHVPRPVPVMMMFIYTGRLPRPRAPAGPTTRLPPSNSSPMAGDTHRLCRSAFRRTMAPDSPGASLG